jgi:Flp pilus assembly protein TadG
VLGLFEVARVAGVRQVLSNAAREGARQAASGQSTNTLVRQVVLEYLANSKISTTNAVVDIENLTNPGVDAASAAQLDNLRVTVTVPYADVRLVNIQYVAPPTMQLRGRSTWLSLRDKPYPAPPEPGIE